MYTYASAFAGIGGMTMGLEPLGFKGVMAWEYDPSRAVQITQNAHQLLHPHVPLRGDIRDTELTDLADFDVFCFTPPCQAFSCAGKSLGLADMRGTLTFDALKIVEAKNPPILFMENVKGLLNHDNGRTFETMVRAMTALGYAVDFRIIDSQYHVPQSRERLYVVAVKQELVDASAPQSMGYPKESNLVQRAKERFAQKSFALFHYDWGKPSVQGCTLAEILDEVYAPELVCQSRTVQRILAQLPPVLEEGTTIPLTDVGRLSGLRIKRERLRGLFYSKAGQLSGAQEVIYLRPEGISNTLTVGNRPKVIQQGADGAYIVRFLSPAEEMRLQAIPEKYQDILIEHFTPSQIHKFMGNGLTIKVIETIAKGFIPYLERFHQK